jgi:hypothetical protein
MAEVDTAREHHTVPPGEVRVARALITVSDKR